MKRMLYCLIISVGLVACSRRQPTPTSPATPTLPSPTPVLFSTPTPAGSPVPRITIVPSATRLPREPDVAAEGATAPPTSTIESPATPIPTASPTLRIVDAGPTDTPAPTATVPESPLPTATSSESPLAPAPTATSTTTPTPVAEGWRFERLKTYYDDASQELYITGEVVNGTDSYQRIASLAPVFYDDEGNLIPGEETVLVPDAYELMLDTVSLAPDDSFTFVFRTLVPEGVPDADKYEILIDAEPAESARNDLEIFPGEEDASDWPDYLIIRGIFENPGPDLEQYLSIVITIYDEQEQVIGLGWFFETASSYLTAGAQEFEIEVELPVFVALFELRFHRYELQIFGR